MEVMRSRATTERAMALAREIAGLSTTCVGCTNCRGLCAELIEALVLPDMVLGGARKSA